MMHLLLVRCYALASASRRQHRLQPRLILERPILHSLSRVKFNLSSRFQSSSRIGKRCTNQLARDGGDTDNPIALAGLSLNIISSSRSVKPRLFISAENAPTPAATAYSFGGWFFVQNSDRKQCSGPTPRISSVRLPSSVFL